MKLRKILCVIVFFALSGLLTACAENDKNDQGGMDQEALDNVNDSGFPLVDETIELKMFTAKSDANANVDWNELPVWNEYESMTNIQLNWDKQVSMTGLADQRNIAIATDGMPDVFFASYLPNTELLKYGEHGVFLPLNDLIEDYAPNLKNIMNEHPEIESGMTFPDGNIYSMPALANIDDSSRRLGSVPWFDVSWLERLNMNVPETTEAFYQFLKGVKQTDDHMVPYGGVSMDDLVHWLRGSFGLSNTGNEMLDMDPNGKGLRFIPTSDAYREMLEYIHKLYDEELIEQDIYTFDAQKLLANAKNGTYASTIFSDPKSVFGTDEFVSASALKGPDGDQLYTDVSPALTNNGQFVITNNNPNPAATVRWMDYFYSDEGSRLMYMGLEDKTYTRENGSYRYADKLVNGDERISDYLPWEGIELPGLLKEPYASGQATSSAQLNAKEKIKPYVPDEIWPQFTYTRDETKILRLSGRDIEKYASEMRDQFISGLEPLDDAHWETYINTLEDMGLEEYMDVQRKAYNRYAEH